MLRPKLVLLLTEIFQYRIFVSASHQTELDTRSMTRRSIIVRFRGEEGRPRASARALPDYVAHQPTQYNEGLMSLAGHGPKSDSGHVCLIIA